MQRTEPAAGGGDSLAMQQQIAPSCWSASCQTCCPFCFWSSATRVRLRSPIGPVAFHTQPCGRRLWVCAPLDRTTHGDLPGADFHRSRGPAGWHARLSCSAWLRGRSRWAESRSAGESWAWASPSPFPSVSPRRSTRGRCINHSGSTRRPHSGTVL